MRQDGPPLIQDAPFLVHHSKECFFFIKYSSTEVWGFESWGIPSTQLTHPLTLDKEDCEKHRTLFHFKVQGLKVLLLDDSLFEVDISQM